MTLKKSANWRIKFDQKTKVKDEPSYPSTLFINHHEFVPWDDTERLRNLEMQIGEEGTFCTIYHVSIKDPDSVFKAFESFTV